MGSRPVVPETRWDALVVDRSREKRKNVGFVMISF
jgi:hypothetical protein